MKSVIALKRKMKTGVAALAVMLNVCNFKWSLFTRYYTGTHKGSTRGAMAATGATDRLDGILPEVATFIKAGLNCEPS